MKKTTKWGFFDKRVNRRCHWHRLQDRTFQTIAPNKTSAIAVTNPRVELPCAHEESAGLVFALQNFSSLPKEAPPAFLIFPGA